MRKEGCIFCDIGRGEAPAKIVFEDDLFIAVEDVSPHAPVRILVIPEKHISEIRAIADDDKELIERWFWTAIKIARDKGLGKKGYRTVINDGKGGGQTVSHIHIHLLSGRRFSWPPG
ncbi:MAG: histidine triad nucleotide-binding protein [Acidobacteriota bacterium]